MKAIQTTNPPNFETVWAALMENREQLKETDRIVKENARIVGRLGSRMGEVVEYMVVPSLRDRFRELGYDFPQAHQNSDVSDRKNNIFLEIDVKLENSDKAMLVEVKTKPTTKDVQDHIKRLKKMRRYADLHGDKRAFLGAVAGVVMKDNVKEFILKQGFFLIEPSGETFIIIPPENKPKEW
jgi:hypothetical protein